MNLTYPFVIGILSVVFNAVKSLEELNSNSTTPCITPNNAPGECIEIQKCVVFMNALTAGKNETFDFIQASRCESENKGTAHPKVCCGKDDNYVNQRNYNADLLLPRRNDTNKQLKILEKNLFPKTCGTQLEYLDKVHGGVGATIGEFPWMARLRHHRSDGLLTYGCVGLLITEQFVLTAAHCILSKVLAPLGPVYQVQLGEHNTETDLDCEPIESFCADPPQLFETANPIVHPEYTGDSQLQNDIAIVPLKTTVTFTDFVFPICLPTTLSQEPIMWISGWGKTEIGNASPIKLKVKIPRVNRVQCRATYRQLGRSIFDSQVCAGGEAGRDSCSGDSGGPLMVLMNNTWYAEGIVSYGKSCGQEGWPGIYTSIPYYLPWIKTTMDQYLKGNIPSRVNIQSVREEHVTWSW